MQIKNYVVHTDGGARGNPGNAAVGIVIEGNGKTVSEFGKKIGHTTNNVAEYTAVIEALRFFIKNNLHPEKIDFILDSLLVVQQLKGLYKIKDSKLRTLSLTIRSLEQQVGGVMTYTSVPRTQNARADFFVNNALDNG